MSEEKPEESEPGAHLNKILQAVGKEKVHGPRGRAFVVYWGNNKDADMVKRSYISKIVMGNETET